MYNILIVDDEYLSRNNLHFLLDWGNHGFQILGEAASASEAISFLKKHQVDIVFTDVYMPEMNGIELAHYIQQYYPAISVVIFSNYSDFDYVKGAFSANVIDYHLKHTLTENTILDTLHRIKDNKNNNTNQTAFLPSLEKERALRTAVRNAIFQDSAEHFFSPAVIAIMKINNQNLSLQLYSDQEQLMLFQNFENTIAQLIVNLEDSVIFHENNTIIIYMPFSDTYTQTAIMQSISHYINQINSAIYKFYNFELLWGISSLSTPNHSIHECFKEACEMLEQYPSKSKHISAFSRESVLPVRLSINMEKRLLGAISDLNLAKTYQCLEEIFEKIIPDNKLDLLISDLTSIASKFYKEFGISSADFLPFPASSQIPSRYLIWSKELFRNIIETRLGMETEHYHSGYAQSVIAYIEANFSDKELSLPGIAKNIGISEQHLSKVFKKETGKNISSYLSEYRIEKAKELIQKNNTNLKFLYNMVGFNDNSYFCTVFKKYENCSPKEYQKKISKKGDLL